MNDEWKYPDVNLTQPVLAGLRSHRQLFVTKPLADHALWRQPAGGNDLLASLTKRARKLWKDEWRREFRLHDKHIGEMVTAVTYATGAIELLCELCERISLDRRYSKIGLDDDETRLLQESEDLFGLLSEMVAELERKGNFVQDRLASGEFRFVSPELIDDEGRLSIFDMREIRLKLLSYAHHLAGLAVKAQMWTTPEDRFVWNETRKRVRKSFAAALRASITLMQLHAPLSKGRRGSECFSLSFRQRCELAGRLQEAADMGAAA